MYGKESEWTIMLRKGEEERTRREYEKGTTFRSLVDRKKEEYDWVRRFQGYARSHGREEEL